jgi:hypothetical protein
MTRKKTKLTIQIRKRKRDHDQENATPSEGTKTPSKSPFKKSSVAQLPFPQEKLQGFLQLVNLHRNQRNMRIVRKAGRQITESILKMQLRTMMI